MSRPAASPSEQWPREVGPRGWAPPPQPPAQGGAGRSTARARTGLIVLAALLTELVIIAAADNQWVSDRIGRNELRTNSVALRSLANSWLTYTWRLSPRAGANADQLWGSQIALVLTVLVVTGLLVAAVVRGPVTFGRAFFGTWTAVIAATLLAGFVRGLIEPFGKLQMANSSRLTRAVFGPFGINQGTVAAGFALGLVVALVAAIVAVTSRRSGVQPADPAAEAGRGGAAVPPTRAAAAVLRRGPAGAARGRRPAGAATPEGQRPPTPGGPAGALRQREGQRPPYVGEGTRGVDTAATTRLPPVEPGEPGRPPSGATDEATTRYRPVDAEDDVGHDPEGH